MCFRADSNFAIKMQESSGVFLDRVPKRLEKELQLV